MTPFLNKKIALCLACCVCVFQLVVERRKGQNQINPFQTFGFFKLFDDGKCLSVGTSYVEDDLVSHQARVAQLEQQIGQLLVRRRKLDPAWHESNTRLSKLDRGPTH